MNVLVYLVPIALLLGLGGLGTFLWTLRSGQYDDLDGAALRILSDDDVDQELWPRGDSFRAEAGPARAKHRSDRC